MEATDKLFHKLLENTASKIEEDAIPADQPGGPSITPDPDPNIPPVTDSSTPGPPYPSMPPNGFPGSNRPPMGSHQGMVPPPNPYYLPNAIPIPYYHGEPVSRKKLSRGSKLRDPEDCDTFEEQVEIIAGNIRALTISGRPMKAIKQISDYYDCVMDENDKLYPEIKQVLSSISKSNLVSLIEAFISCVG